VFDARNWLAAERYYYQAIELLDMLWQQDSENIEAMQGWVSKIHNLAATYEQQGQFERTAQCLLKAHCNIVKRVNDESLSDIHKSHALRMSSMTYKSIVDFKQQHASYSNCLDEVIMPHTASFFKF
jgi:tetratricopeptide (TPR) repeat protein